MTVVIMPFLIIVPFWLLCVVFGIISLFSLRMRFLSVYAFVCSTAGLLLAIVSPFLICLIASLIKLVGTSWDDALLLVMALGAPLGFLVGAVAGYFLIVSVKRRHAAAQLG